MMIGSEQNNGVEQAEKLKFADSSLGYPICTVVEEREKPPENLEGQEKETGQNHSCVQKL